MKRLIHILFLCTSLCGYGQSKIGIDIANPPKLVQPGQFFSLFFTVSYTDSVPLDFWNKLVLPVNWKVLTEKKQVLNTTSTKYIYTISTPNQGNAKSYPIDFQIIANGEIVAHNKIIVNLGEIRQIEITPINQPDFVKEGDVLAVEYLIQNLGNRTERLKLETSRGSIENINDSVVIRPNSYLKVFVKQTIPKTDNQNSWQTSSDLKALLTNQEAPIFKAVSIPVYTSKITKNDPYLRFPIEIGAGYLNYTIGKQPKNAYQYFADGKGFLDLSKKHFLDFTARGPNQFAFPTIGNYDHYSVAYSYLTKTNIIAGDYVLRFNNLMEFGRFGRGLKIEQTVGKTNVMAFYQQARFFPNQKDAFGGRYTVNLKGESNISLNFISKNLAYDNVNFKSNILGLSSFLKKENYSNETEIAVGQAQNKLDIGFFNRFFLRYKQLNINSDIIHAGKNFYGFYTNSLLLSNNINYYLTHKINIGINSNISRVNPSLDVIRYATSPYSITNMAFISYQPNMRNMFLLNFTKQEREDRQTPSTFHFKEDYGNFSYNRNTQRFTLFSQIRYGYAQNLMVTDSLRKKQAMAYMLQPSVALLPWFWVGGYLEYQHTTKFSANDRYQDLYYYGVNARLNYKKKVSMNFMYRNNYAPDELFEKRSFMEGSLIFDLERHRFSLNGGRAFLPNLPNNEQNTLFLTVKYILKLNVPIKKDKKLGYLKGQLICLSEGVKKAGILMQVGQYKVLTDSNGFFMFPNLMPNKYYMTMPIDNNLVGVSSTVKMPIEVNIKADSTSFVKIPLIKTGGIIGKINFENIEADPSVKPIVYIKLYNANESIITELTNKNQFSFKEMKPGSWHLKAIIAGQNEQFEILNSEQEIEIESGQIKQSQFMVRERQRKIQFSGKSFHISSEKK